MRRCRGVLVSKPKCARILGSYDINGSSLSTILSQESQAHRSCKLFLNPGDINNKDVYCVDLYWCFYLLFTRVEVDALVGPTVEIHKLSSREVWCKDTREATPCGNKLLGILIDMTSAVKQTLTRAWVLRHFSPNLICTTNKHLPVWSAGRKNPQVMM